MSTTTVQLFRTFQIPKSNCVTTMAAGSSKVPAHYRVMFKEYQVKKWLGFNETASTMLVGEKNQKISEEDFTAIKVIPHYWRGVARPPSEHALMIGFDTNVIRPLNLLHKSAGIWQPHPPQTASDVDTKGKNRKPDFVLTKTGVDGGSSSSSSRTRNHQDSKIEAIAVGELKSPKTYLGSGLSPDDVTSYLNSKNYLRSTKSKPFVQLFSSMLRTSKGLGVLTNYDHIRFFKIDVEHRKLYMSPLVRVEQAISKSVGTPHTLQTFLYADSLEDQLQNKEAKNLLRQQFDKARRNAELEEKKAREEAEKEAAEKAAGASSSSDQKKSKHTSKSCGKHGKHREAPPSWSIISPVTLILDKCQVIGSLGEGMCGIVQECDYNGMKVAVKSGLPFDPAYDEEDCFAAVENEIRMYEILRDLQGKVIPKMVIGGFERFYNPEAMVIITEKVGMAVKKCDGRLFVGEKELTRKDLLVIKEKGLDGLKKIHDHGVVHLDAEVRNIRVDMKDERVDKVWWIDLGHASTNCYKRSMDGDNDAYENDVDEILNMMDS